MGAEEAGSAGDDDTFLREVHMVKPDTRRLDIGGLPADG
jgi:hypothetical protein